MRGHVVRGWLKLHTYPYFLHSKKIKKKLITFLTSDNSNVEHISSTQGIK